MQLRRRPRRAPTIPIVTLVDILTIVLLFFVATTTFKKKTPKKTEMKITLPQSSGLGTTTPVKETRTTIAISSDKKIFLDGTEVGEADIAGALKAMKAKTPDAKLELQADQDTPLGMLIKVWDGLKSAGYSINDVPARLQRAADAATPELKKP
jgi:biopolymer transport protein ExbD